MTYRRGKYPAFCLAAEEWLEDIRSKVKLSSYAQYKIKLEKNILPFFGEIELDKISSEKVNEFYGYLLTVKRSSDTSRADMYAVIFRSTSALDLP